MTMRLTLSPEWNLEAIDNLAVGPVRSRTDIFRKDILTRNRGRRRSPDLVVVGNEEYNGNNFRQEICTPCSG